GSPDTRGGGQAAGGELIQPDRRAIKPAATEARRIRLRGERGISRQPIAQGMPECSGCTCMLVCALFYALHTRPRVQQAPGIPCSLCLRDKVHANLGRHAPREGEVMSTNVDANEFVTPGKAPRQREIASGSGF